MKYLISTIIPIYNTEKYLNETIISVINQTIGFNKIELILINDGSIDQSEKISKSYSDKYENVIYHYQKNRGVGNASNKGIKLARGEYITFLGSDDLLHPNCYNNLYEISKKYNTKISAGKIVLFNNSKEWVLPTHKKIFLNNRKTKIKTNSLLAFNASPANKIFRRDFIMENNLNYASIRTHVDATFVIPSLFLAGEISISKKTCYYWRQREDRSSISQNYIDIKSINDLIKQRVIIKQFLLNNQFDQYEDIMDLKTYLFFERFINTFLSIKKIILYRSICNEFINIHNSFTDDISNKLLNRLPLIKKIEKKQFKSNNLLIGYILFKIHKIIFGYIKP